MTSRARQVTRQTACTLSSPRTHRTMPPFITARRPDLPPEGAAQPATGTLDLKHALWEHYTVFDGLAGMQVEDILQDSRGYMWIATADGGLSRFDGVHFDNLTRADGLPHTTVTAIAETPDGTLWFGTLGTPRRLQREAQVLTGSGSTGRRTAKFAGPSTAGGVGMPCCCS